MNQKQIKEAQKIVQDFFDKATLEANFTLSSREENIVCLAVDCQEPRILIGEKGRTLFEIQLLLGKILRRRLGERFYLDMDINGYKASRARQLKEIAQSMADKVSLEGSAKALFPMTPYERRIIHLALAHRSDIKTESSGEEPQRRVVIMPMA